jgi:hypothetical protein
MKLDLKVAIAASREHATKRAARAAPLEGVWLADGSKTLWSDITGNQPTCLKLSAALLKVVRLSI